MKITNQTVIVSVIGKEMCI